jgi:hypothetical protein
MRWLACLCLILCTLATASAAQQRRALVVGIDNYDNVNSLMKARNDATAIHAALEDAGVTSTLLLDPTWIGMVEALSDFTEQLGPGDEAIFFFAGHGVQIDGRNFLLMSDVPAVTPGDELLLTSQSLPVDVVLDEIRSQGTRAVMLILDACRDNPFPREGLRSIGGERGLAATEAPEGTFIMFSAGDGQTALDRLSDDDPDPNSVFTRSLLTYLDEPGLPVHEMARLVRSDVRELAATVGHPQFPAIYDQFDGIFTLTSAADSDAAFVPDTDAPAAAPTASADPCAVALPLWQALEISPTPDALRAFIDTQGGCEVLRLLAESRLATVLATATDAPPDALPAAPQAKPTPRETPLPPAGVVIFAQATRVHTLGTAHLAPEAQAVFDENFATGTYFGAFTLSKDGGWGYYTGINSRQAARDLALGECLAAGLDCAIYAELLPADYVDPGEGAITLAYEAASHYADRSTDRPFHAMAVSEDGAYSKVWDSPSQAEADAQALSECSTYRAKDSAARDMPCFLLPPAGE